MRPARRTPAARRAPAAPAALAALSLAVLAPLPARALEVPVAIPTFAEETATSGVLSTYDGEWEFMVGGGAAVFDCNADAYPDLFLAGGASPAGLYVNTSARGGPLTFRKAASGAELTGATGAYPLDIDADGIADLAVLRVGGDVLLRGQGDCRFAPANEAWGFDGGDDWSAAFAATWERGASWPTLAVGTYIDRAQEAFPWGSCTDNRLYRPDADGTGFAPPVALRPAFCALSMLFTDWNRSGTPSLRVSNDREYYKGGQEQLWHLEPGQEPRLYTEAEGWKRLRIWGMGIAAQDLTGDGLPEYFLTSMADNRLQTLREVPTGAPPRPDYVEIAYQRGVTAHRPYTGDDLRPSTAWHAEFGDVNNDGLADLYVVKGNVAKMPDFAEHDPNNLLLQQPDGTFAEAGDKAGIASPLVGRGGALADFNRDGWLDMVAVNRWQPAQIWRNLGLGTGDGAGDAAAAAHWVCVRPDGRGPNRDGIGAWIELRSGGRVQSREVTVGGGHAGGQLGCTHFGLGAATSAEVRVLWPDGSRGDWQTVAADGLWAIPPEGPAVPVPVPAAAAGG